MAALRQPQTYTHRATTADLQSRTFSHEPSVTNLQSRTFSHGPSVTDLQRYLFEASFASSCVSALAGVGPEPVVSDLT
jgi:hypothetical protein